MSREDEVNAFCNMVKVWCAGNTYTVSSILREAAEAWDRYTEASKQLWLGK